MAVTEEMLARLAEAVRPAGADMAAEAEHAWFAAKDIAGDGARELYLAHFASAHPAPEPIEEGVLQPGDKVMFVGRQGGEQGMGTLVRAYEEDKGVGPLTFLEYELDRPYVSPFEKGEKVGGVTQRGALVHARDWPRTLLGEIGIGRELQVRLGEIEPSAGPRP